MNQVKREFNGLGQLTSEWQEHAGSVTGSSPRVQYASSEMAGGANHSRTMSMTYPNGKVLTYNYAGGVNSTISRLSSLSDTSGTLESYDFLGLETVVRRAHSQPGVDLTYVKQSGESNGDAGDQYTGLDRFGRVVDQRWLKTSGGTHTDRFQYGYDRDSNPVYRDNLVNTAFGEVYVYDGLNQLTSFQRGTLNGTKTGISGTPSRTQAWDHDAVGNFDSVTTDGTAQARTHNKQNEVATVAGATTPTFDANGNLTKDQAGQQYVYDAWNRLVTVKDAGGATLADYKYDGLRRRVSETHSGTTTDLYYSDAWQVLEERVGGAAKAQYVWSPVYIDALVLRDRDADGNGSLEERLWVQEDANWNVTALVDGSGAVQERFTFDPFGTAQVRDAAWNAKSGGSGYAWAYLQQGGRLDSVSGLYHFRNRDSSPGLGRWISTDPIAYSAGDVNLYRYLSNSPGGLVDPLGLSGVDSPRAKLTNAIARGDVAEVRATLQTIKETAPELLTPELEAAANAVIQRQVAAEAAAAAQRIAQREIQESVAAQSARIAGKTPQQLDAIRGSIMRPFFKGTIDPKKTEASVSAMRSYQEVARKAIENARARAAENSGDIAAKWTKIAERQEARLRQIGDWLTKNGLTP